MISVILAGGQGVRLWPESTPEHPKQMCDFLGKGSLLDMTLQRLKPLGSLVVVAGDRQRDILKDELAGLNVNLLTEPLGRNTAPAVGLVLASGDYAEEEVLAFFPADHYVEDEDKFRSDLMAAEELAREGFLVTVGIVPAYPETGYGYIERAGKVDVIGGAYRVKAFHEKPDAETASKYIQSGNYYWNAGIFMATVGNWCRLIQEFIPILYTYITQGAEAYRKGYTAFPNLSIDYAIAEKCGKMAVLEGGFAWNDIGNWNALAAVLDQDDDGNALVGSAVAVECSGCLGRSSEKQLVLFGMEDVIAVETVDTILVCPRSRSQDVKGLLDVLKKK